MPIDLTSRASPRSGTGRWVWIVAGLGPLAGVVVWIAWARSEQLSHDSIERALAQRQYDVAARQAERLTRDNPRDARAWFLLGRARAGSGDAEAAIAALEQIPDWSLRKPDAQFFSAQLLKSLHRGREAEAAFRAYLAREARGEPAPLAASARLELMSLYAMEERFEAFRSMFWEVYPSLDRDDRLATLTMRMRSEFEQSAPAISLDILGKFVAADPDDPHAHAGLAAALDHAGRLDEAEAELRKAHQLAPDDVEIRARWLESLYRLGRTDELEQQLRPDAATGTGHPTIARLIGITAQARGDWSEAARWFEQAVRLRPDLPELHHRLSQVLARLGQSDQAAFHAAERSRLTEAREALRKAWNQFADAFESNPNSVAPELLWALSDACQAAAWPREAQAWADLARQFSSG
ncbi:MAG: hypothetical protein KatS3mg108_1813 [Isosphaeraceae bacterium]|nr:MAG: hypothetical protein KatS3mg108_1813 [Isosphaeraceae bacterium]